MSFKYSLVFSFLELSVIFALTLFSFFRSVFFVSLAVILLSLIFSSAAVSSDFSSLLFELSFFTREVFFVVLLLDSVPSVSYTHLDVYKRQSRACPFARFSGKVSAPIEIRFR